MILPVNYTRSTLWLINSSYSCKYSKVFFYLSLLSHCSRSFFRFLQELNSMINRENHICFSYRNSFFRVCFTLRTNVFLRRNCYYQVSLKPSLWARNCRICLRRIFSWEPNSPTILCFPFPPSFCAGRFYYYSSIFLHSTGSNNPLG